ncbi:MAG: MBL fold metallo-hydrolase [Prevotella sp.]|nr:MBL fold metallo-hydrolase [Prevotella sp.]
MKCTVLTDNRTSNPLFATEHGLSVLLETQRHRILLDTGASDVFVRNAEVLGIDLSTVDYVFISHGHADHAGGLHAFLQLNTKAQVIVAPSAIEGHFFSKRGHLHSITPEWPLEEMSGRTLFIDQTKSIADGLNIVAHIPHTFPVPKANRNLFVEEKGAYVPDDFRHELALYTDGFVFTGCAHSGLENILEACPWPVHSVFGGFHLLDGFESEEELKGLANRLTSQYPETTFYTSHCTGDNVFASLSEQMKGRLHAFSCGQSYLLTKKD